MPNINNKINNKTNNREYWLGCDFGTHNIGFSIGQKITKSASPLCVIPAKKGIPNWDQITEIINKWQPCGIIIGLPLHEDGSPSDMSKLAKQFGDKLSNITKIKIYYINEHLSSRTIKDDIIKHNFNRNKKIDLKARIDSLSACLILETWLNINS
tara:strand:+ start:89 stop:553 length:465 start_codon:yes stop_codon:yes gene_type:complete